MEPMPHLTAVTLMAAGRLQREQEGLRRNHPQVNADTEARRERAMDGFRNNDQPRREARERFLLMREQGRIPADSMFGGVHGRKCGVRACVRRTGAEGVRFLKGTGGKRSYRCEACYRAENNGAEPEPVPGFVRAMM